MKYRKSKFVIYYGGGKNKFLVYMVYNNSLLYNNTTKK